MYLPCHPALSRALSVIVGIIAAQKHPACRVHDMTQSKTDIPLGVSL